MAIKDLKQNDYTPHPIDITDVVLSEDLRQLADLLGKNVHEVWAANRIAQGWTCGKERDDERKETPCLVPYEELSETEKQYDRIMAENTIKLLMAKDFRLMRDCE